MKATNRLALFGFVLTDWAWAGRIALGTLALVIGARASSVAPPSQEALLKRAAETIIRYCDQLTNIVAEESYTQRIIYSDGTPGMRRAMVSDFLFVWIPKERSWVEFRDVFRVDGTPVRDRQERIEELFLKSEGESEAMTKEIRDESARYNIGGIRRNINVPTMVLRALMPTEQGRFHFWKDGEGEVDGVKTTIVRFEELSSPTLVRDPAARQDIFSTGTFWIQPETGQVIRSEMAVADIGETMRGRITVDYKFVREIGTWAPVVMREYYDQPPLPSRRRVIGLATYDNFRRFSVLQVAC